MKDNEYIGKKAEDIDEIELVDEFDTIYEDDNNYYLTNSSGEIIDVERKRYKNNEG